MTNDLYEADGTTLDLDAAASLLARDRDLTNDPVAKRLLARVSAAALVDIAASLRVLALESGRAMGLPRYVGEDEDSPEDGFDMVHAIIDAPEGARAAVKTDDPELFKVGTLTGESGVTEGAAWVGINFDPDVSTATRVWVEDVASVVYPVDEDGNPELDVAVDVVKFETEADGGIGYVPPAVSDVEDIDGDFEGDAHAEAADAVAALKARQKAAKKGKGK